MEGGPGGTSCTGHPQCGFKVKGTKKSKWDKNGIKVATSTQKLGQEREQSKHKNRKVEQEWK